MDRYETAPAIWLRLSSRMRWWGCLRYDARSAFFSLVTKLRWGHIHQPQLRSRGWTPAIVYLVYQPHLHQDQLGPKLETLLPLSLSPKSWSCLHCALFSTFSWGSCRADVYTWDVFLLWAYCIARFALLLISSGLLMQHRHSVGSIAVACH